MPRNIRLPKKNLSSTAAEKPTQKQALVEALLNLGSNASHVALAQFVKERFGMKLTFGILIPKANTIRKPKGASAPRQKVRSPSAKCG